MKKGIFRAKATLAIQMMAGQEVKYIKTPDGELYVLFVPELEEVAEATTSKPEKAKSKEEPADEEDEKPAKKVKTYKEDALIEMEVKALKKICDDLDIDWEGAEGKNTARKLTNLILKAQKSPAKKEADEEDEKPKKKAEREDSAVSSKGDKAILAIITKLDEGDINEAKAVTQLLEIEDGADKKELKKKIAEFMEDAEAPKAKYVKALAAILAGEEVDEDDEDEKPKGKSKVKKEEEPKGKAKATTVDELEEGDKIQLFHEKSWIDATVDSVSKKGVVTIITDEDEEELELDDDDKVKIYS